jgi:hypothetical protein
MDNHHVNVGRSRISCGVVELSGLTSDPRKMLYAIATYLYHPSRGEPGAFLVWSDLSRKGSNGQALHQFLSDELIGNGYTNQPLEQQAENPATSNEISIWTWTILHDTFKSWYKEERIRRAKEG